jgi:hypothetical protein
LLQWCNRCSGRKQQNHNCDFDFFTLFHRLTNDA